MLMFFDDMFKDGDIIVIIKIVTKDKIIKNIKKIENIENIEDFFKIKAFIANKEKAVEEHIKATDMLGINYKVMKMPGENKNQGKLKDGKKQDLSNLNHSAKTKIGENNTEELRNVKKKKKKDRPLLVTINYKVMKMCVSRTSTRPNTTLRPGARVAGRRQARLRSPRESATSSRTRLSWRTST